MATIKEIARETGFSPSTVSIVLRGKAGDRHISDKTRDLILSTAQRLGYRVNLAARQLRANHENRIMLSVFMALDRRANMMTHFLLGLQNVAAEYDHPVDITIHTYKSGSLSMHSDTIAHTHCAIICNASDEDMIFLDKARFYVPIVLFLRKSDIYCTVNINSPLIGSLAADIFAGHGRKRAVLLDTQAYYIGMRNTSDAFLTIAKQHGITTSHIHEADTMAGGYNGGMAICKMRPLPDCVFVVSTSMAIGAVRAFHVSGVDVPGDIEIISVGTVEPEIAEYASPSVSTVQLPLDIIAKECMRLIFLQLEGKIDAPCAVDIPFTYIARDSCGE